MADLRWVLLLAGLAVLVGIFVWSRLRSRWPEGWSLPRRPAGVTGVAGSSRGAGPRQPPQKVVTVRLMSRDRAGFAGDDLILALRDAGLCHGRYGIFHSYADGQEDGEPQFSAASLVEPGSFDLARLKTATYPGISLFMALPGPVESVLAFDAMVAVARDLARHLGGDLLDEQGSTLSVQRERYLREEVIQFQHRRGTPG